MRFLPVCFLLMLCVVSEVRAQTSGSEPSLGAGVDLSQLPPATEALHAPPEPTRISLLPAAAERRNPLRPIEPASVVTARRWLQLLPTQMPDRRGPSTSGFAAGHRDRHQAVLDAGGPLFTVRR